MISRFLFICLLLYISLYSFAQDTLNTKNSPAKVKTVAVKKVMKKNLCVNDKVYSPEELMKMMPFASTAKIQIVSYLKVNSSKRTDTIHGIINSSGIDTIGFRERITLDSLRVKKLANILFNYGNKQLPPGSPVDCFMPFNAILFYDSSGRIIACIDISFWCQSIQKYPANLFTGSSCSQKFDVLREFFERAGIKYYGDFD